MTETPGRTTEKTRTLITVSGVVQGVGFRPFVFDLASRYGLAGEVINDTAGVRIDIEGAPRQVDNFIAALEREQPPRADITGVMLEKAEVLGYPDFKIGQSLGGKSSNLLVSPDSCTCPDCLAELFDPGDRRFRYPFINCTNCGPRFTIIDELPYDREATTMRRFTMCPACRAEYDDPGNRRFHAEPNACADCGPQLRLSDPDGVPEPVSDPILSAAETLREGGIVALKSLGGFQLACLANDDAAVTRLRRRKNRPDKPLAVMIPSIDDAALYCRLSPVEREQLQSVERPIVLLERLPDSDLAPGIAPANRFLGAMLPYTPLHFLLMDAVNAPLVMTSGNLSEEPICRTNTEALSRLAKIADRFLLHDRQIRSTYDDSVLMVVDDRPVMLRRARGYAPLPVRLPRRHLPVLATGTELKNTFCLTRDDNAFISQHIGDLENVDTLLHYERTEMLYEHIFATRPTTFVCDSHPGYLSTGYCHERDESPLTVQHHKAHIASCLTENEATGNVVGVACDGTGFGDDGLIWGGEFFAGGLEDGFERVAHLANLPLLGGEAAIREPWRAALAAIWRFVPDSVEYCSRRLAIPDKKLRLLLRQLDANLNCPETSSCGRLFDAVAALVLKRTTVSFEAQAAMELESLALSSPLVAPGSADVPGPESLTYRFALDTVTVPWTLSPARVLSCVIRDLEQGAAPQSIAALFHMGLAEAIVRTSTRLAERKRLEAAALSGGVFQNRLLLRLVTEGLARAGLRVYTHSLVPPNDGGVSLGQAALAVNYKHRND